MISPPWVSPLSSTSSVPCSVLPILSSVPTCIYYITVVLGVLLHPLVLGAVGNGLALAILLLHQVAAGVVGECAGGLVGWCHKDCPPPPGSQGQSSLSGICPWPGSMT